MGKKRAAAAVSAVAAPVFPLPAAAAQPVPDHFSDYGFDPQLLHFFSQPEAKRPWGSRRHHQPAHSKPLDSTRFKLQKPISKAKRHQQLHRPQHQRRRWWSSAALLLLNFKCRSSSSSPAAAAPPHTHGSGSAASVAPVPLYLADDDGPAACTCWAPAVRSGAAAISVPYVSLRSTGLEGGGTGRAGGAAPAMPPIYLVT